MADPVTGLPEGLTARPPSPDDAQAVTDLLAACELALHGETDIDRSDIESDWRRPSFDLTEDGLLVLEDDRLIAHAEVFGGRRAEANVHPVARGCGIGAVLLSWTEERARADGSTLLGQTVTDADRAATHLLAGHGYSPLWTSWILRIEMVERPPEPMLPHGLSFREFVPGRDDREVFQVIDTAFGEWPNRDASSLGDWAAITVEREGFEPWQIPLVVDGDRIVGVEFLLHYPAGAWLGHLAVERSHRGRGLGRALLLHAFRTFFDRGERVVELSTDSRTGALGLYERVGMSVKRSYTHYAKEL
jgi:mycothiol synthase